MYVLEYATWPGLIGSLCDELDGIQLPYVVEGNTATVDAYDPWRLSQKIRCAQNAFVRLSYDVPRPKALLGQQYWDEIVATARDIVGRGEYKTVMLDAAGADSSVMQRILQSLGTTLGLNVVAEEADLQMRIRNRAGFWEVLFRITPRPLGTRAWRVCNYPGALNAVVAAAMVRFGGIYPEDRILNLACGSGTILIERLARGPAAKAIGCDTNAEALACARQNVAAAANTRQISLETWDATQTPLPEASIDLIYIDLPFGQLIGTHHTNLTLYPAMLYEASRLLAPGGRMVVITHEIRLLRSVLDEIVTLQATDEIQITVGGMSPLMVLIEPVRV
jgi:23S rRNA G2445 N2-methylase RlmL